jgi:F420-dependent oxidoreductase-like protein
VVPTFPRHPHALAQQAHTVAAVSGRRFTLGIGLSHKIVIENMLGLSYDKPVRHLREYLKVLMPLSRNETANFDGEIYRVHAAVNAKGSPGFGVVVAALGEQMLRVTAALADGTLTWCTGPATLSSHTIPTITRAAEEFGRPAPRIIAALPVCVTEDRTTAAARAAEVFAAYGSLPSYRAMLDREGVAGPADIAIIGNAGEVQDRVAALADIGVTEFAAVEFGATPDEITATRAALGGLLT